MLRLRHAVPIVLLVLAAMVALAAVAAREKGTQAAGEAAAPDGARSVRLNTLGYLPDAPKLVTLAQPADRFAVIRGADGAVVLEGAVTGPVVNDDSAESLYTADFSALVEPGEYVLNVPSVGRSAPFRVAADLYRDPFHLVTRGMYLWRCGTAVHGEHKGQVYEHAPCHLHDAYLDFVAGEAVIANERPAAAQRRDGTKGWHDAGDYNKYVVNAGVTVGCMFRAWDEFGPAIQNVSLNIPESGGPLPDFLAELKWEIDWLLTMQAPDGSVYHKLSTQEFGGFIMPEEEEAKRYFTPWGSAATADFVAMTAMAARYFRPYDPAYADRCLAAAWKSYRFLQEHPEFHPPDQNAFQTGGYGTWDPDERLWAAAELWETTGDPKVLADLETRLRTPVEPPEWPRRPRPTQADASNADSASPPRRRFRRPPFEPRQVDANWDWGDVKNLGLITYLSTDRPGRNEELVESIRQSLLSTADEIVLARDAHGYARPLGTRYYWGCNGTVARQTLVLRAAYRLEPKPEYRAAALDALNHLFGRNYFGRSYVTGLGDRPPLHPHDRRSGADHVADPWPGYLVGGPHPSARDWYDVEEDYRTNEIAINWNGALIYALAAFLDGSWDAPSLPQ